MATIQYVGIVTIYTLCCVIEEVKILLVEEQFLYIIIYGQ